MKYLITIQYDGSNFYGFQRQNNKRTVQNEIEKALTIINKGKVEIKVDAAAAGDTADASVGEACVEGEVAESMLEMDAIYDVNAMFESTDDLDNK